jgi:hypothetical protein
MGEALGGGGRGAHRWQGGARQSRKRRSSAGEAWDGGCSGVRSGQVAGGWVGGTGSIGRDGGGGSVSTGGAGLNGRATRGRVGRRAVRGRSGGRGAWGRRGEDARRHT